MKPRRLSSKFICIHGHFYQPPRENPWTGRIESQNGASPYHDWNERINAESYEPNANARILGPDGQVIEYLNNYAHISFNFGPTLLRWMEKARPQSYQAILEADRIGQKRFSGHGPAIAQAYHHSILPLANRKDKRTEVLWGVRDFEFRFRRKAEGMWLPETAVDLETLEMLADAGIKYTILSPDQASRVRSGDLGRWRETSGGRINTRRAYSIVLPSGRLFSLFFYNGEIARGVAFEKLLSNGERFAARLLGGLTASKQPEISHIATDGETYGHHHRFGEMALAYALKVIRAQNKARTTVYGELLQLHPPEWVAEIHENTSWSCAHGIERWRSDCGCQTGADLAWDQEWRAPLRNSLNWLRDEIAFHYERAADQLLKDPWQARDEYIRVLLDPSEDSKHRFLSDCAQPKLSHSQAQQVFRLLELQRNTLMMFTSCGWFFNDLAGIETVQILRYAARAIGLAEKALDVELEEAFLDRLGAAVSNVPSEGTGRDVYLKRVLSVRPGK